jgi:hypothetical protein
MQKHREERDGPENKSALLGTAPAPRWCSPRLTKTQRQRVQKPRAKEIEEKKKEVECDAWFNKERLMVTPKKT